MRPLVCGITGLVALAAGSPAVAQSTPPVQVLTGVEALGDWRSDRPGLRRHITPDALPAPYATRSAGNGPSQAPRPAGAKPSVPPGFSVELFAEGLESPRLIRVAPNGDILVVESALGRVRLLRAPDGAARPERAEVFASGLEQPFGLAFYPPGPDPQWIYIAETNAIVRYPYRNGDLKVGGRREVVVRPLSPTEGGHWTRDIAFGPDGARMFVSVGSLTNVADGVPKRDPGSAQAFEANHGLGALWGGEERRAAVLSFTPEGKERKTFATGLRNCVAVAVHPSAGDLYCAVNERDGLGDDLVPDYLTRVREGAFYGWPWFYIGGNEDPRRKGERPDLAGKATVPDVLLQPHSAPLGIAFYTGISFPEEYRGSAFVTLHGSWNRARRTGYKVVRALLSEGVPTGEYEDFLTGFVVDDRSVWARPVGVAVARDGALLVSEDANGTIWRVTWRGEGAR